MAHVLRICGKTSLQLKNRLAAPTEGTCISLQVWKATAVPPGPAAGAHMCRSISTAMAKSARALGEAALDRGAPRPMPMTSCLLFWVD